MITIKFQAKKIKFGTSQGVVIPYGIAKLLDHNKYEYTIKEIRKIKEVGDNEDNKNNIQ